MAANRADTGLNTKAGLKRRLERYLYALIFSENRCYIGQTVDLHRRERAHLAPSGGWSEEFVFIKLGSVFGTFSDGLTMESAWRIAAQRAGWQVYRQPDIFYDVLLTRTQPLSERSLAMAMQLDWRYSAQTEA